MKQGEAGVHLTALVDSPEHVCCRYRLQAFRPMFERAGHSLSLHPLPRSWWSRRSLPSQIAPADSVIIQRKLLAVSEIDEVRRRTARLLFDFDDAVWMRDSFSGKGFHSRRREGRFAGTIRQCDAIIAGNDYLADEARRVHPGARVAVVPTCIDLTRYTPRITLPEHKDLQLVWIGSASTLQGLDRARTLFETLGATLPGLSLKLICDRSLAFQHIPVVLSKWSDATEADEIASADIGISWIPDDPWSRGKCGLKVLQYMAAGLPVIANPVGVHPRMIDHGVHGFLASTSEEWLEAVRALQKDPGLRLRMGAAARRRVEAEYSLEVGAESWLALLRKLERQAA